MPVTEVPIRRRMQPIVAWRAMQELLKDKEDTPQVFVIIRALGGGELKRNCRRFAKSEVGARILRDQTELLDTIANRPAEQSVVATGRGGGTAIRELMDTVSEVKDIKHGFRAGLKARKGVDF